MANEFTYRLRLSLRSGDVLTWLVLINIIFFAVLAITGLVSKPAENNICYNFLGVAAERTTITHRPWTLFTYMVTQSDFLHLLFNMLWLWWFGNTLLYTLSPRHLLWIYITGGLAGALCYLMPIWLGSNPFASTLLMGASSAVLCVMTVAAFRSPNIKYNLLLFGPIRLKWLALISIVLLFFGFGVGSRGSLGAHLGGVAWGCILGLLYINGYEPLKPFIYQKRWIRSLRMHLAARRSAKAFRKASANREKLDELLDKIRTSGFEALSKMEKAQLNTLSRRLNKDKQNNH